MILDRIRIHRDNYRYIRYEKRELSKISKLSCNTDHLKIISESEIKAIFRDPLIDQEWIGTAERLNQHCDIADDTTSAVNPGDRRALFYLTRGFHARRVLEIGTHVGASTIHIAAAMLQEKLDQQDQPKLISVDLEDVNGPEGPWKRLHLDRSPSDRLRDFGCREIVHFIHQKSLDFLKQNSEKYDLIFLDGSHAASVVYQEVPLALNALSKTGIILLHDFFPKNKPLWRQNPGIVPGPWIAIQRFRSEGVPLKVHPLGELPWFTKLSSNITSLAILSKDRS